MKVNIFIICTLLAMLTSCKSKKAIEFRKQIVQKEQKVMNFLVNKGGTEQEKLNSLLKKDFKGATIAVNKQELAFNNLIKDLENLSSEGIKQGDSLKIAAVNYYTAVKELKMFDREEIVQEEITNGNDKEKIKMAQDKLFQLNREELKMFETIREKKEVLNKALEKFDAANGL